MRFFYYIISSIIIYFIYNLLLRGFNKIDVVQVIVFGGGVGLAIAYYFKKTQNNDICDDMEIPDNYTQSDIISKIPASVYYKQILTIGGCLFLTKEKIIFVPHKLNFNNIIVEIPLENILKISIKNVLWGMFNSCILIIHCKISNDKKFLICKTHCIDIELVLNKNIYENEN